MAGAGHCYVCLEEEPAGLLRHACECRSAAVHAACLRRWIGTSRCVTCGVCGEAFAFSEERQTERPTRLQRAGLKALVFASTCPLVIFFVWLASMERACPSCVAIDLFLVFMSVVLGLIAARLTDEYTVHRTILFQGEIV